MRENDAPYMISDWKKAIGKKRLFAKLYAKSETVENFELKKKYRNLAMKERRKAITQFWRNRKRYQEKPKRRLQYSSAFHPQENC